jgi:UDP:flavonoid glycosyltransferase YjiC (YdhE family)
MARLLFTVWPYPTHLHPFIALALEARSQGHEVAFYTGGDALASLAREGFRCFPFREVDWSRVAQTVDDLIAGRKRPSQMRRLWPRFLVETVPEQVRDLEAVLAGWPADALVCDIALWAPILILRERMGIPVIAFSHVAHCILPGPDGPIQGIALPGRRRGWMALYAWLVSRAAHLVTRRTRRRANELRHQFGLPPLGMGVNEFTGALPLYLVPGATEFDNCRRDLPPAVQYVGPCLWDKHRDQAPPGWLANAPRHQPVVVVDEGALFTHEPRVLQMAARGLAGLPLTVILLAGEGRAPASLDLGPLAPNVMLQPHAPLSDILPIADALVSNGNSESVLAALQAGLPAVVLPSIWDQAEMAWRVAETGAGLRISPWRATPERVRRAVIRVLDEPSFRDNAAKMGAGLARGGGPARAAALIGDLVGSAAAR